MHPGNREALKKRVIRAAEAALADHQYVSAIDVMCGMGLLASTHVQEWRKGRIDFLERVIQGNLRKISLSMALFHEWAREKGLRPSETAYVRSTRLGTLDLQFSKTGDPEIERRYRTHFVSPALSKQKEQRLTERLSRTAQPVVFEILRDSQCSECAVELERGSMLFMEAEQPLCLACARLDELKYLPAGRNLDESALTAALAAAVRHRHTEYDELLASGLDRATARGRVADQVQQIVEKWRE